MKLGARDAPEQHGPDRRWTSDSLALDVRNLLYSATGAGPPKRESGTRCKIPSLVVQKFRATSNYVLIGSSDRRKGVREH